MTPKLFLVLFALLFFISVLAADVVGMVISGIMIAEWIIELYGPKRCDCVRPCRAGRCDT